MGQIINILYFNIKFCATVDGHCFCWTFLSVSSSKARDIRDHFLFCLQTFMSLSACLFSEVKRQWAMLVFLQWVTISAFLVSLMALLFALVDRNPF